MSGVKFFYAVKGWLYYVSIIFVDLFMWGLAGLFYTIFTYDIESWAIEETLSLAWRGMFVPVAFIIGHLMGIVFYLSVRSLKNSTGVMKKILEE